MMRDILVTLCAAMALSACDNHLATPEMQKADEAAGRAGSAAKEAAAHAFDAAKHTGTALKDEVKEVVEDSKAGLRREKQP